MSVNLYINKPKASFYEVTDVSVFNKTKQDSFVDNNIRYINGMGHSVFITDRSGIKVEVPPTYSAQLGFTVIKTLSVQKDVNIYIDDIYNANSTECSVLVKLVSEGNFDRIINRKQYEISYFIPKEDIEKKGGSLYLYELDLLVSTLNDCYTPFHPFSEVGYRNIMMMNEEASNTVEDFGFSIKIVDSAGIFGDRFINISGMVFRIKTRYYYDGLMDGVYFVSSPESHGNIVTGKPNSIKYTFEEADEKLKLYRSQEEAETLGDVEAQRDKELKKLSIEVKERDMQIKKEKIEFEHQMELNRRELENEFFEKELQYKKDEMERDIEIKRLKARLEEESFKRKDYYEERNHQRKDTTESLKYIPALLAVFTAVLTAAVALNKKG
jgi:hypothetical protein